MRALRRHTPCSVRSRWILDRRRRRWLDLQQAVRLDDTHGEAYFYLGLTYKLLHQPAQAILAFEQVLVTADDEATRVRVRRHLNELY